MKLKVRKDKISGETVIAYNRVTNKLDFRYSLLNRVLENRRQTVAAVIDTNRCVQTMDFDVIDKTLAEFDVLFDSWSVKKDEGMVLGVRMELFKKKQTKTEKMYIIKITQGQFSKSLFERVLQHFDLALGFSEKIEMDVLREALRTEPFEDVLFGQKYFEHSLYDSVMCSSLRSSFDISRSIEEAGK